MKNASRMQPSNLVCQETQLYNICRIARVRTTFAKEFQTSNIISNILLVSTFEHNGDQSILNKETPPWNKIEPSIFFDEAKCGPLHML